MRGAVSVCGLLVYSRLTRFAVLSVLVSATSSYVELPPAFSESEGSDDEDGGHHAPFRSTRWPLRSDQAPVAFAPLLDLTQLALARHRSSTECVTTSKSCPPGHRLEDASIVAMVARECDMLLDMLTSALGPLQHQRRDAVEAVEHSAILRTLGQIRSSMLPVPADAFDAVAEYAAMARAARPRRPKRKKPRHTEVQGSSEAQDAVPPQDVHGEAGDGSASSLE